MNLSTEVIWLGVNKVEFYFNTSSNSQLGAKAGKRACNRNSEHKVESKVLPNNSLNSFKYFFFPTMNFLAVQKVFLITNHMK